MVQDLLDLILLLVIVECRTWTRGFSCGEQLRIVRDCSFEETCMERGMDLVVWREFKLVRGRLRVGLDDVERSNVTIEELRAFSLLFNLEAKVLGAEVD
jgi:hypothetical protein